MSRRKIDRIFERDIMTNLELLLTLWAIAATFYVTRWVFRSRREEDDFIENVDRATAEYKAEFPEVSKLVDDNYWDLI